MSKTTTLAKNTLLIAISRVSTQLVTFLMLPVYTAVLSPAEYGVVDLVATYALLMTPLIMLNVQQAVFRFLIDIRSNAQAQREVVTNAVEVSLWSCVAALLLYLLINSLTHIPFAATIATYFTSFVIGDLVLQIARGLGHVKAFAITGITQGMLTIILNLILLLPLDMGIDGMLLGTGLGVALPAAILALKTGVHRLIKPSARNRQTKKELLSFSMPLLPNTVSWWVFNASDRTIISLAVGVAANGIYAVTNKFANIANSFSAIFYTAWSEAAVLAINDPDRDVFFSRVANLTLKTFGTLGVLIMSVTPLVFPILVDSSFRDALLYLPVLTLGVLFNTIVSFYSAIYLAKKLTKQVTSTSIIAATINIVINLALVWHIGIWAAAISTAVAYGAMSIYRHYDMKKYVSIEYEKGIFAKLGALFIIVTTLYYIATPVAVIASIVIASCAAYWLNYRDLGRIKGMALGKIGKDR